MYPIAMNRITVTAVWDDEASVWVAQSDDVPGRVTEAESLEDLAAKLEMMIPKLLEANGLSVPAGLAVSLLAP